MWKSNKCKPVSRVLFPVSRLACRKAGSYRDEALIIYLAPISQSGSSSLPPRYPGSRDRDGVERAVQSGLFGLSTRKVCRAPSVTLGAVSSYLTVSPFPRPDSYRIGVVCFLWHCLSPTSRGLPVRKYDALCCPDFPPRPDSYLPSGRQVGSRGDKTACINANIGN